MSSTRHHQEKTEKRPIVSIIFPPYVYSAFGGPHLAPALLSAILNRNNIKTRTADFNIRLIKTLLEPPQISEIKNHIHKLENEFSIREYALIDWVQKAVPLNLLHYHKYSLRLFLRLIGEILFPQPPTLVDCLSDNFIMGPWRQKLYEPLLFELNICHNEIIAFSVAFGGQLSETIQLCRLIRNNYPENIILLGGSQINLLEEWQINELVNSDFFDAIVIGNCETMIKNIINNATRSYATKVIRTPPLTSNDLKDLPIPDFNDGEIEDYYGSLALPVLATKGCYWGKCTFCDYAKMNAFCTPKYISRPVNEVLDEINEHRSTKHVTEFQLISDGISPAWYSKLSKQAIKRNIPLSTWSYMLHSKNLTPDFLRLLKQAGVRAVNFGSETTCDRILRLMNKSATRDLIIRNIKNASEAGLEVVMNIIIDFPSITFKEAISVANDLTELGESISVLNPQSFDLTSGTSISDNPNAFGIKLKNHRLISSWHGYHSIEFTDINGLSPRQHETIYSIFLTIASRHRIAKRLKRLEMPITDDDLIRFDRSILLYEDGGPKIDVVSLRLRWEINEYEYIIYKEILKYSNQTLTLGQLRKLWNRHVANNPKAVDFFTWLDNALKSGTIEEVTKKIPNAFS
jgi:hypothetical protein